MFYANRLRFICSLFSRSIDRSIEVRACAFVGYEFCWLNLVFKSEYEGEFFGRAEMNLIEMLSHFIAVVYGISIKSAIHQRIRFQ